MEFEEESFLQNEIRKTEGYLEEVREQLISQRKQVAKLEEEELTYETIVNALREKVKPKSPMKSFPYGYYPSTISMERTKEVIENFDKIAGDIGKWAEAYKGLGEEEELDDSPDLTDVREYHDTRRDLDFNPDQLDDQLGGLA